ncbi:hypothetical protein [Enterococcus sp. 2201sp1_2201st1_B8_2201SCRN_220225]|uniref:hypothetical protein n=1 Tax=Enterococcus sp. 2201sp1_2201st1_B8_2201SCRN_220225 TaxID=3141592 RepID=UPI0034A3CFDD
MSDIDNGRKLVQQFMTENKVYPADLAAAYGKTRSWVDRAVRGVDSGPAVNTFLLQVIRDYKLRGSEIEEG